MNIPQKEMADEPPPVLGTWRNVYTFVLVYEGRRNHALLHLHPGDGVTTA